MTIAEINKKIVDLYGLSLDGQPKFRVVWTSHQLEKRKGKFPDQHGILIEDIREVPKYSYAPDRWVLEMWTIVDNPELMTGMGYEPLWIFQDKLYQYLPPSWPAIETILWALNNRAESQPRNEKMDADEEQAEFEKSKQVHRQYLEDVGDSDLVQRLKLKTAILNPLEKSDG